MSKYASNGADWISFYVWFGWRPMVDVAVSGSIWEFKVTPAGVPDEGAVEGFSSPPKEAEGILLLGQGIGPSHRLVVPDNAVNTST